MTNYVLAKLSFKNAKRFDSKKISHVPYGFNIVYTRDKIDEKVRTNCPEDNVPMHCVTNLVSVLMGDRPIPTKKTCSPYEAYDQAKYADIASRCHVEVVTNKVNKSTMTANKCFYAHAPENTHVCITLDDTEYKINRSCPTHQTMALAWHSEQFPNEYNDFDDICIKVLGADYKVKYSFTQTLSELRKLYLAQNQDLLSFLERKEDKTARSTGFYRDCIDVIKTGAIGGSTFRVDGTYDVGLFRSIFSTWLACPPTHGSPEETTVMSGNIYMKLTEDEWLALLSGPMCATFMDSGYVEVPNFCESWDDAYESLPTPFIPSKE